MEANNDESGVKSRLKADGTNPHSIPSILPVSRRSIIIVTTFDLHDASSHPVDPRSVAVITANAAEPRQAMELADVQYNPFDTFRFIDRSAPSSRRQLQGSRYRINNQLSIIKYAI